MAEYINKAEVENILKYFNVYNIASKTMLEQLPTIDIARCRECIWAEEDGAGVVYCTKDVTLSGYVGYDWFCAEGMERWEDE